MSSNGSPSTWIRDHAVSLGFYLYAVLLAPPLARALQAGMQSPDPVWLPGILVMAVLLAEPVGLFWKLRFLRRRNFEEGVEPQGPMLAVFSAAGIGHALVTMFMGMLVLDGWGALGIGTDDPPAWGAVVLIALVLKEFVGLMASAGQAVSREPPGHWKESVADTLLLAYGCVAYTAWWGVIINLGELEWKSLGERLALMTVFGGIFLFFYLPMRLPFLLEEYHLRPARGRKARIWAELAIGAALGLYPAFF